MTWMTSSSRAPVLSATLIRDSLLNHGYSPFSVSTARLDHVVSTIVSTTQRLSREMRAAFNNLHLVTNLAAQFIMRLHAV